MALRGSCLHVALNTKESELGQVGQRRTLDVFVLMRCVHLPLPAVFGREPTGAALTQVEVNTTLLSMRRKILCIVAEVTDQHGDQNA